MKKSKRWLLVSIVGSVALVGAVVSVVLFGATGTVNAAATTRDLGTITQVSTPPGLLNTGYLSNGGGWGPMGRGATSSAIDYAQLLANALGISVDDLQSAYETARENAIAQAVDQGLITQEQADQMLVWGGAGARGFGLLGRFGRGDRGVAGGTIDEEALLADALGISVADLQTARDKANEDAVAQAVQEGIITQEQADEMLSRRALQSYLDRDALLAQALGMSVTDLQTAYADGQTLSDLMAAQGMDAATVRANLQQAYQDALAQAVTDGVITQEQADQMQAGPASFGGGSFMGPGCGGFGGHGHGGFRGAVPGTQDNGNSESSGTRFQPPSRIQSSSGSDV